MKIVTVPGVLACMIGAAKADELVGTIDAIDTIRNTISLGEKIFAASPQNTVCPRNRRSEDCVKIFYAAGNVRWATRFNAITVEKQGE